MRTEVVKVGEKSIGYKSRLFGLAKQFLPEFTPEDQSEVVANILSSTSNVDPDLNKSSILDALSLLDASDKKVFKDVISKYEDEERQEIVHKRFQEFSKKDADASTPAR